MKIKNPILCNAVYFKLTQFSTFILDAVFFNFPYSDGLVPTNPSGSTIKLKLCQFITRDGTQSELCCRTEVHEWLPLAFLPRAKQPKDRHVSYNIATMSYMSKILMVLRILPKLLPVCGFDVQRCGVDWQFRTPDPTNGPGEYRLFPVIRDSTLRNTALIYRTEARSSLMLQGISYGYDVSFLYHALMLYITYLSL